LVLVDKPAGWTSHDVVARIRKLAGTRRVGHAGTLDPAATGVLVLGIGRATRLLGHLSTRDKDYAATVRLGAWTHTDDAEGDVIRCGDRPVGEVTDEQILAGLAALTGDLLQVPSSVSAISVGGQRAHARIRAGEEVTLPPRPVHVASFELDGRDGADLYVRVTCSSGTYVRALARDLGELLGTGGHLVALRRTRVGPYSIDAARSLSELAETFTITSMEAAVTAAFPCRQLDAEQAIAVGHGRPLDPSGFEGPTGVFAPGGELVALLEDRDGAARPLVVFMPAVGRCVTSQ
jgi:tRNA pseudouridine55 synthase